MALILLFLFQTLTSVPPTHVQTTGHACNMRSAPSHVTVILGSLGSPAVTVSWVLNSIREKNPFGFPLLVVLFNVMVDIACIQSAF